MALMKECSKISSLPTVEKKGHKRNVLPDNLKNRHIDGRLAKFCSLSHGERLLECDAYFESTHEYYFERSSDLFEYIIDFYVNGRLHRPLDVCPIRMQNELEFWRIPITMLSKCCQLDSNQSMVASFSRNPSIFDEMRPQLFQLYHEASCSLFKNTWLGNQRMKAWNLLENPRSSLAAKSLSLLSAFFVLLSLAVLILASMPEFQDENQEPHWFLTHMEMSCMLWFTLEYIVRFAISPKKLVFLKSPLNIIDLLTIVPFYVEMCLPYIGIMHTVELRNIRGAMIVVRVTRLARVTRIFKLARYSTGLRAFGQTMQKSAAELSMLGMFLLTGIMLFSTAIYFFERDEPNSKFYSIPAACVITMTTVGYGDLVPATAAFPISMIIDKFAESTAICWDDPGAQISQFELLRMKRNPRKGFFSEI
ncbi:unnamed protein product [Dracunculus medinensis]|uniref:BTB domain-containing protein n=1 Tax=Dracunculus medinensis TaxID=318479 RepID=A0A0N4UL31_DRAME|nr:unnamed protein product [Dracunculus medinensis]